VKDIQSDPNAANIHIVLLNSANNQLPTSLENAAGAAQARAKNFRNFHFFNIIRRGTLLLRPQNCYPPQIHSWGSGDLALM